jgi:gluconolactonase
MAECLHRSLPTPQFTVVTEGLRFPEGPVALKDGSVIVVEIAGRALTHVHADGRKQVIAKLRGGPNGAALGPDGWVYVCNSGGWRYTQEANGWRRPTGQASQSGWIERVSLATGAVERLYDSCGGRALRAPNDLVFDRHGGFYFTDHGKRRPKSRVLGGVYYARADGSGIVEVVPGGMLTPNGVGLASDGRTLYVADTGPRQLWAFDLTGPGRIVAQPWPSPNGGRIVAGLPDMNYLDSLALDSAGHICVASFNNCGIWEISADGSTRIFRPLPDFYATNIAFGGPDLSTAFVTLSSTGRLVSFRWPRAGQPLPYVNFPITEQSNA